MPFGAVGYGERVSWALGQVNAVGFLEDAPPEADGVGFVEDEIVDSVRPRGITLSVL